MSVRADTSACSVTLPVDQFQMCFDTAEQKASNDRSQYIFPMLLAGGVFIGGGIVGAWYHYHPHPIEEGEAKSLAQDYNDNLRRQLGLPTASRAPLVRELRLAPAFTGTTGGLVLAGRF